MSRSNASVLRATSVSSSRRTNVPPVWRANRKLNSAVRAVPMWSGPVGLGAIRTRMCGHGPIVGGSSTGAQPPSGAGTLWNRPGSASPGRTRISAAGRRPSVARPRGPSRVRESSDSLRARIVIARARRQRPRLEVGQQPRVLLGLLGDPQDRRLRPRLHLGRAACRPAAGARSRGRSGCRAGTSPGAPGARRAWTRPAARGRPGGASPRRRSPPRSAPRRTSAATRAARGGGRSRPRRPGRLRSARGPGPSRARAARPPPAAGTSRWRPGW